MTWDTLMAYGLPSPSGGMLTGIYLDNFGVVAILPRSGALYAPFDATIAAAFPTGHAIGLRHADGAEVLIHIGIDSVTWKRSISASPRIWLLIRCM